MGIGEVIEGVKLVAAIAGGGGLVIVLVKIGRAVGRIEKEVEGLGEWKKGIRCDDHEKRLAEVEGYLKGRSSRNGRTTGRLLPDHPE